MDDVVLNVSTLPEPLHRRSRSDKVRVHEVDGVITLTPVTSAETSDLWGMLPDGKFTTEKYLAQKRLDKELEP